MTVTELWVYPVKSLAGQAVPEAALALRGFENDRRWMLVDENGRFVSQREHAHLARWQASLEGDDLLLTQLDTNTVIRVPNAKAEDGQPINVQVWGDNFTARSIRSQSP